MLKCEKCGCDDERYFGIRNGKEYCRRCISFIGEMAKINVVKKREIKENLKYPLSPAQEEISSLVRDNYASDKNTLIYAVCGAGKTELVYKTIAYALTNGKQVGLAIPRKDVVIELAPRIKEAFPEVKVVSVYGGHHKDLEGDIVICTTHQLFRYVSYFDLLIIDETDAFPYSNNESLMNMFDKSIRGNYIMMSATPLKWMEDKIKKEKGNIYSLMARYHKHPLIEPTKIILPMGQEFYIIKKLKQYKKENKPCFIFCPTIYEAEGIFPILKMFVKSGKIVHSKKKDRNDIIFDFKNNKFDYLVTTSVLERGVTLKNIQVIVFHADSNIYTDAALIQISGRVGRKIDAFDGEVIFICKEDSEMVDLAIKKIKEANNNARVQNLLL